MVEVLVVGLVVVVDEVCCEVVVELDAGGGWGGVRGVGAQD